MWVEDHVVTTPKGIIEESVMSRHESLVDRLYQITKSNFHRFTVFPWMDDDLDAIAAMVFAKHGIIRVNGEFMEINRGEQLMAIPGSDLEISDDLIFLKTYFSFSRKKDLFGTGSKKFDVTAVIKDEYRISVMADCEEEAVRLAHDIPVYEWQHPDIEPNLTERQIVRYARWGNLSAKESE